VTQAATRSLSEDQKKKGKANGRLGPCATDTRKGWGWNQRKGGPITDLLGGENPLKRTAVEKEGFNRKKKTPKFKGLKQGGGGRKVKSREKSFL